MVCHCVKYDSFLFILFGMRKIWPVLNYVSPVLMQNEDIWNFHGSLILNTGKLI